MKVLEVNFLETQCSQDFPNLGMGTGTRSREWERMGTRKSFPHISSANAWIRTI